MAISFFETIPRKNHIVANLSSCQPSVTAKLFSACLENREVNLKVGTVELRMNITSRVPWSEIHRDVSGPESFFTYTNLLPCRYFVQSLESKAIYDVGTATQRSKGQGVAHIETNYGSFFPSAWTWNQAIAAGQQFSLCMVGGEFDIGPFAPMTWCLCLRHGDDRKYYRTVLFDRFDYCVNGTAKTIEVFARRRWDEITRIKLSAPSWAFGEPLFAPTGMLLARPSSCPHTSNVVRQLSMV